jgi:hypothetical protein
MKKITTSLSLFLFYLAITVATHAQLKDGEIVKIKNVNSRKYARPFNGSADNNAQIVLFAGSDESSKWKAIVQPGGYYMFQNVQSKLYLSVLDASREQYGFISQTGSWRQSHGLWKLEKTTTGFKLKNKNSNLFLVVEGGNTENNAKLIQWGDQGQPDIQWQFEPVGSGTSTAAGKKVLFDVVLNYIAVSEATRNRIDNGDCKRVFGQISTELWELDENNEMKTKLRSYNNMPEMIYNQTNHDGPPTAALSYYQDNPAAAAGTQMGKVTYNIPESLLKEKKVMLVVKTYIGTRHKDNDFASYDALRMQQETQHTYILDYRSNRAETIQTITDLASRSNQSTADMILLGHIIPSAIFARADDTHKLWVAFTCKRN